jgi:hypothetical protein
VFIELDNAWQVFELRDNEMADLPKGVMADPKGMQPGKVRLKKSSANSPP